MCVRRQSRQPLIVGNRATAAISSENGAIARSYHEARRRKTRPRNSSYGQDSITFAAASELAGLGVIVIDIIIVTLEVDLSRLDK